MKDVRSIYKNYSSFIYTVYSILRKSGICSFVFFPDKKKVDGRGAEVHYEKPATVSRPDICSNWCCDLSLGGAGVSWDRRSGRKFSLIADTVWIYHYFPPFFFFLLTTAMSVGGIRGLYSSSFPKGSLNYHTLLVKKRRRPKTA